MTMQRHVFVAMLAIALCLLGCESQTIATSEERAQPGDPTAIGENYVLPPSAGKALAPGDLIKNVNLAVSGTGVSVAVDCEGVVYYTLANQAALYKMDKDGNDLGSVQTLDPNGDPVFLDELAWDDTRGVLWGGEHLSNPVDIYHINPTTGVATFQFQSQTNSIGTFRDGLAFDGTDDTIWISGDVSTTIEHYQTDGTFLNQITPTDAAGNTLGAISGVIVGVGDLLYLGRNGNVQIVQVKKSDGSFLSSFASPGGARDEGLECDVVNFAPLTALWSREFNPPGFMSVIEVEPGTCACGGGASAEGRMTGGGSVFDANGTRFTHGFELHCDADEEPNNLEINWPKSTGKGSNRFHLESLDTAFCSDDPGISEENPVAGFDTFEGTGTGRLNGASGVSITFKFTDAGEPGKGADLAEFTIDALPQVSGTLNKGNQQAHPQK